MKTDKCAERSFILVQLRQEQQNSKKKYKICDQILKAKNA